MRSAKAVFVVAVLSDLLQSAPNTLSQPVAQQRASRTDRAKCVAYARKPYYTPFWSAHHFSDSGVFTMRVNVKTGRVVEVRVIRSTGHTMLDKAAFAALNDWRFKPGCLNLTRGKKEAFIRIPVTFVLPE